MHKHSMVPCTNPSSDVPLHSQKLNIYEEKRKQALQFFTHGAQVLQTGSENQAPNQADPGQLLEIDSGIYYQQSNQSYVVMAAGQRIGEANNLQLARTLQMSALNPMAVVLGGSGGSQSTMKKKAK